MSDLYQALRTAMQQDSVPDMLAALLAVADTMLTEDDKERAFEILAFIREYPMYETLREQVEVLYDELKYQLCPRAVADAHARAESLTLDDVVLEILSTGAV